MTLCDRGKSTIAGRSVPTCHLVTCVELGGFSLLVTPHLGEVGVDARLPQPQQQHLLSPRPRS